DFVTEVRMQGQRTTLLVTPNPTSANAATFCPEQVKSLLLPQLNDFVLCERIQQETAGVREALIRTALVGCSYWMGSVIATDGSYRLLPFRFMRLNGDSTKNVLITGDTGEH
ncbi:hypothetical protein ACWWC5_02040, partial [Pseudomonas aeruginosa]